MQEVDRLKDILKSGRVVRAVRQAIRSRTDGLRVYRPIPAAARFHESDAMWRICVGGNRSGKTMAAAVEVARAVRGLDPYKKYPKSGVAVVIGLDSDHHTMLWRKLTQPGSMKVVFDPRIGEWRSLAASPDDPSVLDEWDLLHRDDWFDSGPLIPQSEIAECRTPSNSGRRLIRMKNGWTIIFVTSQGKPKQGEHYDLVWIDEQIRNVDFFYESVRGLLDCSSGRGHGIWSAAPQHQNTLLWSLSKSANEFPENVIEVFEFSLAANPYVPKDDKDIFRMFLTEEEAGIRVDGKYAVDVYAVYPDFNVTGENGCEPFEIPPDWTRYLALDPGTTACATVFGAVNPDDSRLYIYDAVLQKGGSGDAVGWAQMLAAREDRNMFYMWTIDRNAGRARSMGQAETVASHYYQAAAAQGIRPAAHGDLYGFHAGNNDPNYRRERMRSMIKAAQSGGKDEMGLVVFRNLTSLVRQVESAQVDRNTGKRVKGEFDLLDALEYLVCTNPRYVGYEYRDTESTNGLYEFAMELKRKNRRSRGAWYAIF